MCEIVMARLRLTAKSRRESNRRLIERKPSFLKVSGLVQKIFGHDPASGDICGIYFFENQEALAAYRDTRLAKCIQTHMKQQMSDEKCLKCYIHFAAKKDQNSCE